jgi:hypothetical protein
MQERAPGTIPYPSPIRTLHPLPEILVITRVEWAVTIVATLTRKVAGKVLAVMWGYLHPVFTFETAEDEKRGGA